jgi:hypothetical protein
MHVDAFLHWLEYHFSEHRRIIRGHWDKIEQNMHDYLEKSQDEMFFREPSAAGEDNSLIIWQLLPFRIGNPAQRAELAERRLC